MIIENEIIVILLELYNKNKGYMCHRFQLLLTLLLPNMHRLCTPPYSLIKLPKIGSLFAFN